MITDMQWSSQFQSASGSWWSAALASPLAGRCAVILILGAVVTAWLLIATWRVTRDACALRAEKSQRDGDISGGLGATSPEGCSGSFRGSFRGHFRGAVRRLRGDRGTAIIEFAWVFPILLVMVLLLIQTTLLFTGNLFVHYAAFAAARTASVEIAQTYPGEGLNQVAGSDSGKLETIRRTAVLAMWPVSGPGTPAFNSVAGSIADLYSSSEEDPPAWINNLLDKRLGYANEHTTVTLERILVDSSEDTVTATTVSPGRGYTFRPRDPVGVRVFHSFHLSIPYVSRLFADGRHDTADGASNFVNIQAGFMLTGEGIDDALPEPPAVRRGGP